MVSGVESELQACQDGSSATKEPRLDVGLLKKVAEPTNEPAWRQSKTVASMRLIPIVRVTRDKIPLAWLDTAHAFDSICKDPQGGRVFTNYSDALADWFRGVEKASKTIQIVREKSSGRLCAVERVRYGDYAICAIGAWVSEELIIGKATPAQDQNTQLITTEPPMRVLDPRKKRKEAIDLDRWWEVPTSKDSQVLQAGPTMPEMVEATTQITSLDEQKQTPCKSIDASSTPSRTPNETETMVDIVQISPAVPSSSDPEMLCERFLVQYLDALYIEKTSLAFFTKGPLARVRAAFHGTATGVAHSPTVVDLTSYLRQIIISLNMMEKKYKERLPSIANDAAIGDGNDDETGTTDRKRRRKLKYKPSKDGLHLMEEAYARKWWRGDTDMPPANEPRDQQIKRRLESLRVRETLLQIVIVLEVLSLEDSSEWKKNNEDMQAKQQGIDISVSLDKDDQGEVLAADATNKSAKKKGKDRQQDLLVHLDLLVDRIAIWHSLKYESEYLTSESGKNKSSNRSWSMDMLGGFCIDVIVPFFKHRLPSQVSMMVSKFGGPSNSPEKSRSNVQKDKGRAAKQVIKPTTEIKPTHRKGLHRTPTEGDARIASRRVPGLVRASTDTSLLQRNDIKRESSEVPLSAIPLLRDRKPPRRDSAEKLRLLQKRTVSFSALNATKKRKAAAEEEVRAAIESIKRPNRGQVGREVADERDQRELQATKKQTQRKILDSRSNVQVAATPKHHRKMDVFSVQASISQSISMVEEPETIPSSGIASRILDTVHATKVHDAITETPSVSRIRKLDLLAGTHSRNHSGSLVFSKPHIPSIMSAGDLFVPTPDSVLCTPSKNRYAGHRSTDNSANTATPQAGISATDRTNEPPAFPVPQTPNHSVPSTPQKTASTTSASIYASLGWDDYPVDD